MSIDDEPLGNLAQRLNAVLESMKSATRRALTNLKPEALFDLRMQLARVQVEMTRPTLTVCVLAAATWDKPYPAAGERDFGVQLGLMTGRHRNGEARIGNALSMLADTSALDDAASNSRLQIFASRARLYATHSFSIGSMLGAATWEPHIIGALYDTAFGVANRSRSS